MAVAHHVVVARQRPAACCGAGHTRLCYFPCVAEMTQYPMLVVLSKRRPDLSGRRV